MYMCVKIPPRDLNPGPCPLHLTSTYTYEVTIAPKVCGGNAWTIINFTIVFLNFTTLLQKVIVGTRFSLTQSWMIRPWPKKSHTMKFVEYGLKNSVPVDPNGSLHVLSGCRNVNHENVSESRSSIHGQTFIQWLLSFFSLHSLLSPFSPSPFLEDSYI